jgi:hypothetical protein
MRSGGLLGMLLDSVALLFVAGVMNLCESHIAASVGREIPLGITLVAPLE